MDISFFGRWYDARLLLYFSIFIIVTFFVIHIERVRNRLIQLIGSEYYRKTQLYLLLLVLQLLLISGIWYVDTYVTHVPNAIAPFIILILIATLMFGGKFGLLNLILIAPFIVYFLLDPKYVFFSTGDEDKRMITFYHTLTLLSSVIIGYVVRRYQAQLYAKLDIIQEIHWRTRRDLSSQLVQKSKEEATLKSIHEAALAIDPAHMTLNKVLPAVVKQSSNLLHSPTSGLIVFNTREHDKTVYSTKRSTSRAQSMCNLVEEMALAKKRLSYTTVSLAIPELLLKKYNLTRKDGNAVLLVGLDTNYKSVLFVVRSIDDNAFTDTDKQKLQLFAAHASLTIRNAQHHESLTGLMHARDQFASVVAHELKTPLSTIKLYAQLYSEQIADKPDLAELQKGLITIDSEVDKITKIVNSILDFTRIQSGKFVLEMKPFNLAELVKDRVKLFQSLYPDHTFVLENMPKEAELHADKIRIDQVLTNMLMNAVKYSPNNTAIRLKVKDSGDFYKISITDNGIGIAKEEQASVFEPFFQAKNLKSTLIRPKKGVGLGLFISKSIVALHKGSIDVSSQVGVGTTFTITLPKAS